MTTITISSYSAAFTAPFVTITSTGTIANNASVIYYALDVQGGGVVTNNGTIEYLATPASTPSAALYFGAVGSGRVVTNQSQGVILGGQADAIINADTVTNAGSIGSGYNGVILAAGGSLSNTGTITAGLRAVRGDGATVTNGDATHTGALIQSGQEGILLTTTGTVANDGTIISQGDYRYGVHVAGDGAVTNGADNGAASIYAFAYGVKIDGSGSIGNSGTIEGKYNGAVLLGSGTVTNSGTAASIYSYASNGVFLTTGTVVNDGRIVSGLGGVGQSGVFAGSGTVLNDTVGSAGAPPLIHGGAYGVRFGTDGTVVNGTSLLTNGTISAGGSGVYSGGSLSVANYGTVTGFANGISAATSGIVTNSGSIYGYQDAVAMASGTVTNGGSGGVSSIVGHNQNGVSLGSGTVVNDGHIGGNSIGVSIGGTGVVMNDTHGGGLAPPDIAGSAVGVYLGGGTVVNGTALLHQGIISGGVDINFGTILNNATITAGDYGIFNENGGLVVNGRHGLISGGGYGISFGEALPATVDNAGTIIGSTAIQFNNPDSRLIVREGSDIQGRVPGGFFGATDTLRFARGTAGRQDVFRTAITNFGTVGVDSGANWLTKAPLSLAAGARISVGVGGQLEAGAMLRVPGNAMLTGGGILAVSPTGRVEIGTAGGAKPGAITIDAHRTLSGAGVLSGTVDVKGALSVSHGLLAVDGALIGPGTISIGAAGTFMVAGTFGSATHVAFKSGAGERLTVVDPAGGTTLPEIAGFGTSQAIDLQGVGLATGVVPAGGGTYDLTGLPGGAIAVHLDGVYSTPLFQVAADSHGGTLLTYL